MGDMNANTHIVLAIHRRHAQAILRGEKTHELRKRLPRLVRGDRVYLYETAPTSAIVGGFTIGDVSRDTPMATWQAVGDGLAISKPEFDGYVNGSKEVIALQVSNTFRLRKSATREDLLKVVARFTPPQSAIIVRDQALTDHLDALATLP